MTAFERRVVVIAPGAERAYDAREWAGALVVVEAGEIELECRAGGRCSLRCGAILWLDPLPVRVIRNPGRVPAVVAAVARRRALPF